MHRKNKNVKEVLREGGREAGIRRDRRDGEEKK
jgi:hypothetical protein